MHIETKDQHTSMRQGRKAKHKYRVQKYRGMFEIQKSENKTSSGENGLNIRTLASPEVGQDQVSGGVSVLCWHAASVANVLYTPLAVRYKSNSVIRSSSVTG